YRPPRRRRGGVRVRTSCCPASLSLVPRASASRLDLVDGHRHQLVHGAADLVIGLGDAFGVEILAQLSEHVVVPGLLDVGDRALLGVGFRGRPGYAELLGGPQAEQLVAAGVRLELELLVVRELLLEAFLALVERGHCRPSYRLT